VAVEDIVRIGRDGMQYEESWHAAGTNMGWKQSVPSQTREICWDEKYRRRLGRPANRIVATPGGPGRGAMSLASGSGRLGQRRLWSTYSRCYIWYLL